jgi:hypothetical protein
MSLSVRELEEKILRSCISELLNHGFELTVSNGMDRPIRLSTDADAVFNVMRSVEEERILVFHNNKNIGWIYFVCGNDGWDVICDYTINMERYLTKTFALIEELGG